MQKGKRTKDEIKELEEKKVQKDLENCTFKPTISKRAAARRATEADTMPIYERLNKEAKDKDKNAQSYKQESIVHELKECTF